MRLIKTEELIELLESYNKLTALERGGVDNWEWYRESINDYNEEISRKVEYHKKYSEGKYSLDIATKNLNDLYPMVRGKKNTIENTCCFTGHRPDKLPGGYNWYSEDNMKLTDKIKDLTITLIELKDIDTFIFGGALGVDQLSFATISKLKDEKYPHVKLVLAIPFYFQYTQWSDEHIKDYMIQKKLLADERVYVDELDDYKIKGIEPKSYHPAKMQKRNEYMIDNSGTVVSVWNTIEQGGTFNCIKYAKKKDRKIININPDNLEVNYRI